MDVRLPAMSRYSVLRFHCAVMDLDMGYVWAATMGYGNIQPDMLRYSRIFANPGEDIFRDMHGGSIQNIRDGISRLRNAFGYVWSSMQNFQGNHIRAIKSQNAVRATLHISGCDGA